LALCEETFGTRHPTVATCLHNLAQLYLRQHRYAQAEPLYQRALSIWAENLRPNHPNIGTTLNQYARLLHETRRDSEAEAMKTRATEILSHNPELRFRETVDVNDLKASTKASEYKSFTVEGNDWIDPSGMTRGQVASP
jgi:tetratricopeptide (TPR) repeat protein